MARGNYCIENRAARPSEYIYLYACGFDKRGRCDVVVAIIQKVSRVECIIGYGVYSGFGVKCKCLMCLYMLIVILRTQQYAARSDAPLQ